MFTNYVKIMWRNIVRQKLHTLINVAGLALGMTCCTFIFLWVKNEKDIDNRYTKGENLYELYNTVAADGKLTGNYASALQFTNGKLSAPMDNAEKSVPGITYISFYKTGYELPWGHAETFEYGQKKLKLEGSRASSDFLTMFALPIVEGNAETALNDVSSIAISRKMAEMIFGNIKDAMGKIIRYENRLNFTIKAVFENLPVESSLRFDFLINWEAQLKGQLEYSSSGYQIYFQLVNNADVQKVTSGLNSLFQSRAEKIKGVETTIGLQRFGDVYLHNVFVNGKPVAGRIEYVNIFSSVALFILIIACVNFMNMATARSVKRAKEVGLRKVIGSTKGNLMIQFFCEALFFAALAMLVSLILLYLFLPAFNHFTRKEILFPGSSYSFWIYLAVMVMVTGVVAGSYPALYLSSLKPVRILKGVLRFSRSAIMFRKSLTVFQFALSIMLIIGTAIIMRQVDYIQHVHLGYDRANLVYIRIEGDLINKQKYLLFKSTVSTMPGIALVDRSTEAPHQMNFDVSDPINWEGKSKNANVAFKPASVGFDFVKLMNMSIVRGRDFSPLVATDSSDAFLINEEAAKEMGMKDPIGKWVSAWKKKGHIIGILKDYHTQSLRDPIKPVLLDVKEYEDFGVIIAKTRPGKTKQALASLEKVYRDVNPAYPFAFQFVDDEYNKMYSNELVVSHLAALFASLAITISCLGLLGLVMFSAEQRVKEIGIRKVLGASLNQIFALFSREFLQLVFLAFVIAAPIAWYVMNFWLQDFAYRITVSWWIFLLAGGCSVVIALATISYQSFKSALANPVKSLRNE